MIKTPRLPDWASRFKAEFEALQGVPFVWGATDCMRAIGRTVHAITGIDPTSGFQGYKCAATGQRLMLRRGFPDWVEAIASEFATSSNRWELDCS